MQTITKVALDAMGGDNAPAEIVKGAVDAVASREDIKVYLVGQTDVVQEELNKYPYLWKELRSWRHRKLLRWRSHPYRQFAKRSSHLWWLL